MCHTFKVPNIGMTIMHRDRKATAALTRANNVATYIPNILKKTSSVLAEKCVECKKHGPTIL